MRNKCEQMSLCATCKNATASMEDGQPKTSDSLTTKAALFLAGISQLFCAVCIAA